MKSLVTGAGGFAGSHLVEHLLELGDEVIALVNPQNDLANLRHILSKIRIERIDIRDPEPLSQLLGDTRPHRLYHLAALSSPLESLRNVREAYDVNFLGTFNLLSAWRQLEIDCKFLFVSSSEVYGVEAEASMPLREDRPFRPGNPYAASKAAGELLAFQFCKSYGLPIVRVRPFNHTGPRQPDTFVCSSLARQVAEIDAGIRPPIVTAGNLKLKRDFSDVRDIARGYRLLLEKGVAGDVYQLCSGRAVQLESILQTLSSLTSKPITIALDESKVRSREVPAIWGDPSKANQTTGWVPQYDLETTLRDLEHYWVRNLSPKTPGTS